MACQLYSDMDRIVLCFLAPIRMSHRTSNVKRDKALAKYWLNPVSLAKNRGFKDPALKKIAKLVEQHQQHLLEAWHEFFDA